MDYTGTLDWLKNLLTQNQTTQGQQFNQGLGFNQEQLGQQGKQFDANLALQKVIADWQNQLAGRAQTQAEQGQQFNQNLQTKETSFPFMATTGALSRINSPQNQADTNAFLANFFDRLKTSSDTPMFSPASGGLIQPTYTYQAPSYKK